MGPWLPRSESRTAEAPRRVETQKPVAPASIFSGDFLDRDRGDLGAELEQSRGNFRQPYQRFDFSAIGAGGQVSGEREGLSALIVIA